MFSLHINQCVYIACSPAHTASLQLDFGLPCQHLNSRPRTKVIRSLSGCRKQADAPNHASKKKKFNVSLRFFLAAMPCGCSVALRSLSHILQFRHPAFGQLLQMWSNFIHFLSLLHFTILEPRHPNRISFRFPSVIHFSSSTSASCP